MEFTGKVVRVLFLGEFYDKVNWLRFVRLPEDRLRQRFQRLVEIN